MTEIQYSPKIKPEHLARRAIVYLRQSSEKQVRQNKESQRLQYDVAECVLWVGNKWRSSMVTLDPARLWLLLVGKDSSASSVRWH